MEVSVGQLDELITSRLYTLQGHMAAADKCIITFSENARLVWPPEKSSKYSTSQNKIINSRISKKKGYAVYEEILGMCLLRFFIRV